MQTLARFQTAEEAHLLRAYLEAQGVPGYLFDENLVHLFWYYSDAIGGVRLMVPDEFFEEARDLSRAYAEEISADRAPAPQPRLWPLVLLLSWCVGLPMIVFGRMKSRKAA